MIRVCRVVERSARFVLIACAAGGAFRAIGCGGGEDQGAPSTTTSGGTSGGGGHGGTGTTGTSADACTAPAQALGWGDHLTVTGTTAQATDDYSSFCGDTTAAKDTPDVVVALSLRDEGTFSLSLRAPSGSALDPAFYLRSGGAATCGDDAKTITCQDVSATKEAFRADLPAGTYYVIVDGSRGTAGEFELTASLDEARCGDGVVGPGEECDPGPAAPGDGCSDPGAAGGGCKLEKPDPKEDVCPGEHVSLAKGELALEGTTIGFGDDYRGSCAVAGGRDRVYEIVPQASGTFTAAIGYAADGVTPACTADITSPECWDYVLYLRTSCASGAAADEKACSDSTDAVDPERVTAPVVAGKSYWLIVDGADAEPYSSGPYRLRLSLE